MERAFVLPKAFHWNSTAFPIITHYCEIAELKKCETNSLSVAN